MNLVMVSTMDEVLATALTRSVFSRPVKRRRVKRDVSAT